MDVHQKKAAVFSVVVALITYTLVIWSLRLTASSCIIVAVCFCLFAFIFLKINHWMRSYLNGKEYPNNDWYRKHSERNFDILILGDDISSSRIPDDFLCNKKVFDCSLSDQNLYVDFLVLKNTFSILKPQGIVYIPLREASIKYVNDKFYDERRYYWVLSPYVFNQSPFSCALKKIYKRIPGLLFRFRDLLYLLQKMFVPNLDTLMVSKRIEKEAAWLKNTPPGKQEKLRKKQEALIEKIRFFCIERDIQLKIIDIS